MYQALYRKWRPRTFDDVVGQEPITTTLKNEIREGRPAHAYLLMGSRGTGKTTCAKLIAKAVNCLSPQDGSPCGVCDICRGIDNGSVVDVTEIDAASNSGVDNIRELREEAVFLPTLARYRVYIIDEVHMLSIGAVNALLKIMEEPPEHVIFILATTEVHRIPATIQSRCQRFDFRRIGAGEIAAHLRQIAAREELDLHPDAAQLIGRLADGGMRDALSILDLCASHSRAITVETVSSTAGLVAQDYLFDLARAIRQGDLEGMLTLIQQVGESVEYDRICTQLTSHYRNLLVAASTRDPGDLIVALPDAIARYQEQAAGYPVERILYALQILQETQAAMARTASRRAQLEIAAARLCDPRLDSSPQAMLARIQAMEEGQGGASHPAPSAAPADAPRAQQPQQPPTPPAPHGPGQPQDTPPWEEAPPSPPHQGTSAPQPEEDGPLPMGGGGEAAQAQPDPAPSTGGPGGEQSFAQWDQVLATLGKANPALRGSLIGTQAYLVGSRVLIASENPVFLEMMRSSEYTKDSLKDAIQQVTGTRYPIGPYTGQPAAVQPQQEAASPLEDLLRQAQEAGVEVRLDE